MEIYLIRHTSINCEKVICYGQADVEVSGAFSTELNSLKKKLGESEEYIFYSSPLKRCSILAQHLSNADFIPDKRLMEMHFGDWELKSWELIEKEQYFQKWRDNFVKTSCPNGESFIDLSKRNIEFFEELIKKDYKKVAIITHSGTIRTLVSHILEIPLNKALNLQIDYGSITKIKTLEHSTCVEYVNK